MRPDEVATTVAINGGSRYDTVVLMMPTCWNLSGNYSSKGGSHNPWLPSKAVGIALLRLFIERSRDSSRFKFPKDDGMEPVRALCDKFKP
ncbi:hypothetical protein WN943_004285 [Citrus x changshan-huyou]